MLQIRGQFMGEGFLLLCGAWRGLGNGSTWDPLSPSSLIKGTNTFSFLFESLYMG